MNKPPFHSLPWGKVPILEHPAEEDQYGYGEIDPLNEDYILHACNAYPKLVQHLKAYLECARMSTAAVEAYLFLVELGELDA